MKDLLKIISAKSLNIIAKKTEDDNEEIEDQQEAEKKQEEEEEIAQEVEEKDEEVMESTEEDLKNIEDNPEHLKTDKELLEEEEDELADQNERKSKKTSREPKEEDDFTSDSQTAKSFNRGLDIAQEEIDEEKAKSEDYSQISHPGDEERDEIRRLKMLKARILKRLKITEETDEGDTDE